MQSLRLAWAIIWRMAGSGLQWGAVLGLVLGLVILGILAVADIFAGRVGASGNYGASLVVAAVVGILVGGLLGSTGGAGAGVVMAMIVSMVTRRQLDVHNYRTLLRVVSVVVGGPIAFAIVTVLVLPATIIATTPLYEWILYAAVPVSIAAAALWMISKRVLYWVESQPTDPAELPPPYHRTTPLTSTTVQE